MAFAGYINSWRIHRGDKVYDKERPGRIGMLTHNSIISKECYFLVKVRKKKKKKFASQKRSRFFSLLWVTPSNTHFLEARLRIPWADVGYAQPIFVRTQSQQESFLVL